MFVTFLSWSSWSINFCCSWAIISLSKLLVSWDESSVITLTLSFVRSTRLIFSDDGSIGFSIGICFDRFFSLDSRACIPLDSHLVVVYVDVVVVVLVDSILPSASIQPQLLLFLSKKISNLAIEWREN